MDQSHRRSSGSQAFLILTAIGIVFGDIGTSPLYALRVCFSGLHAIDVNELNVYGVLSLIFWSLIVVISLKYLQFILRATNKGEGGVLALTALSVFRQRRTLRLGRSILLALGLFGAALLVGDGMITPAISVLSAVEGLNLATPIFHDWVMPIAIVVLIGVFSIQRFGTSKIGSLFGPIMVIWFATIALLGLWSIVQEPRIMLALNPYYAFELISQAGWESFYVLGAVFLAVTGGEALYADVGHFGREAITRAWYFCALPALILNYFGQGALLLRDPMASESPFFRLAPEWGLYPLIGLSTIAAIIASQALISGIFSLSRQCVQLGYSPRLQIVHTNEHQIGQIYVPFINWTLLVGTIWLVIEFHDSNSLSAAYGMGIATIIVISSILAGVVAWSMWGWSSLKTLSVVLLFMVFDVAFLAANSLKFKDGGWVPLAIAVVFFFLMTTWKRGREILIRRLRANSYPFAQLLKDIEANPPTRVKGTAIFMVGDTQMTPPALMHNLRHNKVLHENIVFLTVVSREVPHVPEADRVQISELAPTFYRIVAYYGFSDSPNIPELLNRCSRQGLGVDFSDPTYFLGRDILSAKRSDRDFSYWRKKVFVFMARNAMVATTFFGLPQEDVIEVGMETEI